MSQELVITRWCGEIIAAILEECKLLEIHRERLEKESLIGNIYLGRIEQVLPGVGAVFVNLGLTGRQGYLQENEYTARLKRSWGELKKGQPLMVQVMKDPGRHKGLSLTTRFNIPGRWLVLLPYGEKVVLSHRFTDPELKERLHQWGEKYRPDGMGLIVRTSAQEVSESEFEEEVQYLTDIWRTVSAKAEKSVPPALLYEEQDIVRKIVLDILRPEIKEVLIDDPGIYQRFKNLAQNNGSRYPIKITRWNEEVSLYTAKMIPQQINAALQKKIWLPSGGYLIIEENEALTTIDVNTGKNLGRRNLSQTLFEVNMEAVDEIARQIRLRNIGGIIIVDFGGIPEPAEQEQIIHALINKTSQDPLNINIYGFTHMGLLEMTRKKRHLPLSRVWLTECTACNGTGRVTPLTRSSFEVTGALCEKAKQIDSEAVGFAVHPEVAAILSGGGGAGLAKLEEEAGKPVYITGDEHLGPSEYKLVVSGTKEEVREAICPLRAGDQLEILVTAKHRERKINGIGRIKGFVVEVLAAGCQVGKKLPVHILEINRTYAVAEVVQANHLAEH